MLMVRAMLCGNERYLFSHLLPLVAWAHREHRGNYFLWW